MSDNIKWAKAEIEKHRQAIADLEAYVRVAQSKADADRSAEGDIPKQIVDVESTAPQNWLRVLRANGESQFTRGYKKRTILATLLRNPSGLRTPQIVDSLIESGLKDSNVANTSPQLSAYGSGESPLVKHDGGIWTLTQEGRDWLASAKI
jgi:hypothetical protein